MGIRKLKNVVAAPPQLAKPPDLLQRVAVLEKQVADILAYPPLAAHAYAILGCEERARAEREHKARYEAAAPQRAKLLADFAGEYMVAHVGVGAIPYAVQVAFHAWLAKRGLGSALTFYREPDEVADALLTIFPDATRADVVNEKGYPQPGVAGCALVPDGKTGAQFIAEIEAARTATQKQQEREESWNRDKAELARVQADLAKDAERAREDQRLANRYMAEQYRAGHPELDQRPNATDPAERAREHELERRQAAAQPA